MGKIVSALSVVHTPGLTSLPDAPPKEQTDRIAAVFEGMRKQLAEAKPELIIAIIDDHFENYFRESMPVFSLAVGDEFYGPLESNVEWLRLPRQKVLGHRDYATDILKEAMEEGFDIARSEYVEFAHNLMIPLSYLRPEIDIPVVPIFINCFTHPLPTTKRVYELGRFIRKVIDKRPENVAVIASGGLSHWPPFWHDESPEDDAFMQRMKEFQTKGVKALEKDPDLFIDFGHREVEMAASDMMLINTKWDQEVLAAFGRGDVDYFLNLTHEEIKEHGGNGGPEILMWIAMMGVLNGAAGNVLHYEAVTEWMGSVASINYEEAIK